MTKTKNRPQQAEGIVFTSQNRTGLDQLLHQFSHHTHPAHYYCRSCGHEHARCPQDMIGNGQAGKVLTAFNGCSDSRGNPATVFQPRMGDMFPIINAGAFLTPYEMEGGTTQAWASIEYAVTALKVCDIVQFGHTECGAISGLVTMARQNGSAIKSPHLKRMLGSVSEMVDEAERQFTRGHGRAPDAKELCRTLEFHNAAVATKRLQDFVDKYHPQSDVRIHGWLYDMRGANIMAVQEDGSFQPITHLPQRADYGRLPSSCDHGVAEIEHRLVFHARPEC